MQLINAGGNSFPKLTVIYVGYGLPKLLYYEQVGKISIKLQIAVNDNATQYQQSF